MCTQGYKAHLLYITLWLILMSLSAIPAPVNADVYKAISPQCAVLRNGLRMSTYSHNRSHPSNSTQFQSMVDTYASVSWRRYGGGTQSRINGVGNPYGQDSNYLSLFNGFIYIPSTGTYYFGVDGDDAVEVRIDGHVVTGWYGGHGRRGRAMYPQAVTLEQGYHLIDYRHEEGGGGDNYYLYWKKPGQSSYSIVPSSAFKRCGSSDTNNQLPDVTLSCDYGIESGLTMSTYDNTGLADHPSNAAALQSAIDTYAVEDRLFGSGTIAQINGTGNPYSSNDDYYLSVIKGYIQIPQKGEYTFGVDGDDVVELRIDNTVLSSRYGSGGYNSHRRDYRTIWLEAGYHAIELRHSELYGADGYQLFWNTPTNRSTRIVEAGNFYQCAKPATPIGEWRFDDSDWHSGAGTVDNHIAGGTNGTNTNAISTIQGKVCGAAQFNRNSTIEIPHYSALQVGGANQNYSVTFWYKPHSQATGSWQSVMHKGNTNSQRTFSMWQHNTQNRVRAASSSTSNHNNAYDSNADIVTNQWHHLAMVQSGNTLTLYKDGVSVRQRTFSGQSLSNNGSLYLGDTPWHGGFEGMLDELRVFNKAITQRQVQEIMADTERDCPTIPLVEHRFNKEWETDRDQIIDSSPFLRHSTSHGSASITEGKICTALDLTENSNSDYISLSSEILNGIGNFTISMWVKDDAIPGGRGLLSAANTSNHNELLWWINSDTQAYLYLHDSGSITINSPDIANNQWHHLVWRRNGVNNCYFVDGVERICFAHNPEPLEVAPNGIILGQEQDSVGGGFDINQDWEGLIDEFIIFGSALSNDEITAVYQNQNDHKTWDGQPISCPDPLIAKFHFDEEAIAGTNGIEDSSGNNRHGTVVLNTTARPTSNQSALTGSNGTCGFINLDYGKVQIPNLPVSTEAGDKTTLAFWMKKDSGGFYMPMGWNKYDLYFSDPYFGFNTSNSDVFGVNASIVDDNRWHHIVAEFTNGDVQQNRLFIDGTEQSVSQLRTSQIAGHAIVASTLNIGGWSAGAGYRFNGDIDELHIYDDAISQARVNALYNARHECPNMLDHFVIEHDNTGIYCANESIRVIAHGSAGILDSYVGTVTLDTQTGKGSWQLINGQGSFSDAVGNDGIAQYTFVDADDGIATFALSYKEGAETINIDAYEGTIRDDDTEGDLRFSATGFTFTASPLSNPPPATLNTVIPPQTSGTTFPLSIAAYGMNPSDGQCGIIESYHGNKNLDLWVTYINPNSGTMTPTIASNTIGRTGSPQTRALTFNQGQATVNTFYGDVGRIQIHAQDGSITGATTPFVVAPDRFAMSTIDTNPAAATATDGVFKKAGETFQVRIDSLNAQGNITPNFGNESPAETLALSHTLVAPIGGHVGVLDNEQIISQNAGRSVLSTAWSEVGILQLSAHLSDQNYLNSGVDPRGDIPRIGRFVPDHFELTSQSAGQLATECSGDGGFNYTGQPFGYKTGQQPAIRITAKSQSLGNPITRNYDQTFAKLTASDISLTSPATDSAQQGQNGSLLPLNYTQATGTLTGNQGVFEYRFGNDQFTYPRDTNAMVSAFNSDIDLSTRSVTDSDGVAAASQVTLSPQSANIRYGRLRATSNFGSELADLTLSLVNEIYDTATGDFISHDSDTACTAIPSYTLQDLDGTDLLDPANLTTQLTRNAGDFLLTINAPEQRGSVQINYDVPSYLQFPWQSNSEANPASTATFGIYRGNASFIYQREAMQ